MGTSVDLKEKPRALAFDMNQGLRQVYSSIDGNENEIQGEPF